MIQRRIAILVLLAALIVLSVFAGRAAGPLFSRKHHMVQLAEHLWTHEEDRVNEQSLLIDAYLATGGLSPESIYEQAHAIQERFRTGGGWFGLWVGLVAAIKILSLYRERRPEEYEADRSGCLACARCYLSCPVELERRGLIRDAESYVDTGPFESQ